ncbi:hypothetical protein SDC9_76555 [bioreactor metagenome]|uniref:Uncharacterized protein n=1 Tax=bioreactor metagenome TaxID=1076179 RepID=A0A644YU63_9ZZZZ
MAQQLLNAAQIGARIQEMRGERVTQFMRREIRRQPRRRKVGLERPLKTARRQPAAVAVDEYRRSRGRIFRPQLPAAEIFAQRLPGGIAQHAQPFLASLAAHLHHPADQIEVAEIEADRLADPQPPGIDHFDQSPVPGGGENSHVGIFGQSPGRLLLPVGGNLGDQPFDRAQTHHLGQLAFAPLSRQPDERIVGNHAFTHQVSVKGTQRRKFARDRVAGEIHLMQFPEIRPGVVTIPAAPVAAIRFAGSQQFDELPDIQTVTGHGMAAGQFLRFQILKKTFQMPHPNSPFRRRLPHYPIMKTVFYKCHA